MTSAGAEPPWFPMVRDLLDPSDRSLVTGRMMTGDSGWRVPLGKLLNAHDVGDVPYNEWRDQVVAALRSSSWVAEMPAWEPIHGYLDQLAAARQPLEFITHWLSIIDEANYHRVVLDKYST